VIVEDNIWWDMLGHYFEEAQMDKIAAKPFIWPDFLRTYHDSIIYCIFGIFYLAAQW